MSHVIDYLSGTLNIERSGNQYIAFSNVTGSHILNVFPNFSIKYVYDGNLSYKIDSGSYQVSKNDILYAASQPGEVCFDNPNYPNAIGLCIGINEQLFLEALRIHSDGCFNADPEDPQINFLDFPEFLEGLYHKGNKKVCSLLYNVCSSLCYDRKLKTLISDEWFISLAEEIVTEEISHFRSFKNLNSTKTATKKELLKRLSSAKQYMDDCYLSNPLISEISKIALLSEYHFYRSFKLAYGISPYQYLLNKRLDFAKEMIQSQQMAISITASLIGFSDQFSFSKSFKKKFKVSPSEILKSLRQN